MNKIEEMINDQKRGKRIRKETYYDDSMKFYDDYERYRLNNLNNKDVIEQLDILINTVNELSDDHVFYLYDELPASPYSYRYVFQNLIEQYLKDKQIAYHRAYEYKKNYNEFNKLINSFKSTYINANLYLDILIDLCNYIKEKSNNYSTRKTQIKRLKKELLDEVYDSNLSLIDYSFYNTFNIQDYKYLLFNLSKNNEKKNEEIKTREDKTIRYILILIDAIRNKDIDIVEYYELTKLHPILLVDIARKNKLVNTEFTNFLKLLNSKSFANLDVELKSKLIINQEEVSEDIKRKAFEYLNLIEAPTTVVAYKTMVRKLIKK